MIDEPDERGVRRRSRISYRTQNLSTSSSLLHRIDHATSLSGVAVGFALALVAAIALGWALGFPTRWVNGFEISASAVTLLMVFVIQHTQAREQASTQRKLDELIRALPGASEKLMMLEEAPKNVLQEVEDDQREVRSDLVADEPSP
ncbi:MAG: hypothetical protein JWM85_2736 [Acidimicrobiaceae bacterium]|nr:hypothetical protein [Acidimicrobiaceae bacterium]